MLNLGQQSLLLDPPHHVGAQLIGGIVGTPSGFPKPDCAGGDGDDGISRRSSQGDVGVVFCCVDVQMMGLRKGRVVCYRAAGHGAKVGVV